MGVWVRKRWGGDGGKGNKKERADEKTPSLSIHQVCFNNEIFYYYSSCRTNFN